MITGSVNVIEMKRSDDVDGEYWKDEEEKRSIQK